MERRWFTADFEWELLHWAQQAGVSRVKLAQALGLYAKTLSTLVY